MNEQSTVLDSASAPPRSRRRSHTIKVIVQNNEIPRFRATDSSAPMLTSAVVAQPPRAKKKNLVRAVSYSTTMPTFSGAEWRVRLSRAARTRRRRIRTHRTARDADVLDAGHCVPGWPPAAMHAVANRATCDCRQPWGRPPGRSASHPGIRPRRIPPSRTSPQLTPPARGSTGVPDSLDTKQVNTSGPAAMPCGRPIRFSWATLVPRSPSRGLLSSFCFTYPLFIHGCARRRLSYSGSSCNGVTCANMTGKCMLSAESWPKFPEFIPENYCVAAWQRVTFVVSPGKRKTKTSNRPECEPAVFTARRAIIEKGAFRESAARTFRERNCR